MDICSAYSGSSIKAAMAVLPGINIKQKSNRQMTQRQDFVSLLLKSTRNHAINVNIQAA